MDRWNTKLPAIVAALAFGLSIGSGEPVVAKPKSAASAASVEPYSMHGIRLGTSLDEFKAIPIPTEGKFTDAEAVCKSDMDLGIGSPIGNEIECEWDAVANIGAGITQRMEVSIGNGVARPVFDFTPDQSGALRLYKIEMTISNSEWDLIYPAFVEHYGAPQVEHSIVQNGFGASMPSTAATWSNSSGEIEMQQTCQGRLNIMCITYTDRSLDNLRVSKMKGTAHF